MIDRCHNPKSQNYRNYGARGIFVCDEWRSSFERFVADMGPRPSLDHSVDRKDNDGPYSKDNCRWATRAEQARNTRQNRWVTIGSETLVFVDWCRRYKVPIWMAYQRLHEGWALEDALTRPYVRTLREKPRRGLS